MHAVLLEKVPYCKLFANVLVDIGTGVSTYQDGVLSHGHVDSECSDYEDSYSDSSAKQTIFSDDTKLAANAAKRKQFNLLFKFV